MAKIGKPSETQEAKIERLRQQIERYSQRQKYLKNKPQQAKIIRRRHYET